MSHLKSQMIDIIDFSNVSGGETIPNVQPNYSVLFFVKKEKP